MADCFFYLQSVRCYSICLIDDNLSVSLSRIVDESKVMTLDDRVRLVRDWIDRRRQRTLRLAYVMKNRALKQSLTYVAEWLEDANDSLTTAMLLSDSSQSKLDCVEDSIRNLIKSNLVDSREPLEELEKVSSEIEINIHNLSEDKDLT